MNNPALLEAWSISHLDYPIAGPTRAQLAYLVRYGVLAPSSHNTQPWLFGIADDQIDLYLDRQRFLDAIDPHGRQLVMSCGAALLNLRIAARRFGREDVVEPWTGHRHEGRHLAPGAPLLLARIGLGRSIVPLPQDVQLFDAIPLRHTNRQPFALRPVSYRIAEDLASVVAHEGAWMVRLEPAAKRKAADLVAIADEVQYRDKRFRRELSSWLATGFSRRRDGVPTEAKNESALMSSPMLVRACDMSKSVAARERALATAAPLLVVIGTDGDRIDDWMRAGQAVQRVLLAARTYGLSASFLSQVVEVAEVRPRLAELTGRGGYPQVILRLGYGPNARPTPRRELEDVLLSD